MGAKEVRNYVGNNTARQYKILDEKTFEWEIHVINKQIHEYENTRHSITTLSPGIRM